LERAYAQATALDDSLGRALTVAGIIESPFLEYADLSRNLLPEDEDEPWSNYLREKLRRKFLHEVESVGEQLEREAQWQKAIAHYQRALDADNLAEAFYRGLMRCLHALDRSAEAISVYQRMERLFSITLGLQPTTDSQKIYRSLFSKPVAVMGDKAGTTRQSRSGE